MNNSNPDQITVFAETTFRNQFKKFGIKTDDRRRHMYIIGKTGMGKSTLMENMIIEDIRAGRGVAVVDPHGELAEKIIQFIPDYRLEDVVYFNPADVEHPIAFNIAEHVEPHLRPFVASGLIGVFKKLWADSWGPRLEYILRNAILAVLDYPGTTLLAVTRMLADKQFRKRIIETIQDPVVKAFWVKEFASYADKFASEAVAPIQNKVGQFLSSSMIRNIIGQTKSSIDIRDIMDKQKILIMNLSKGRIGEDNTQLLGAMMITKIQLAAMSRVDMPEADRKDFYLYVDEFQNFATESFANILSEARKYRLNLIMGHQFIEQLTDEVKAAVFGNVGTLVTYRVGATDAELLVKEFTPTFTEEDLVNQPKFNFCLKLMIDGVSSDPFTARSLPPLAASELTGNEQVAINLSRQKYASVREDVEKEIAAWHEDEFLPPRPPALTTPAPGEIRQPYAAPQSSPASSPQATVSNPPVSASPTNNYNPAPTTNYPKPSYEDRPKGFEVECSSCGKLTRITFEPDGIRPVFCKDCLVKSKEDRKRQMDARHSAKEKELASVNAKPTIQTQPPLRQGYAGQAPTHQSNAGQAPVQNQALVQPRAYQRNNTSNIRPSSSVVRPSNVGTPDSGVREPNQSRTAQTPIRPSQNTYSAPARPASASTTLQAVTSEPKAPELSLSDLSKRPATDFHGRPIVEKEVKEYLPSTDDGPVLSTVEGDEKVLFES